MYFFIYLTVLTRVLLILKNNNSCLNNSMNKDELYII